MAAGARGECNDRRPAPSAAPHLTHPRGNEPLAAPPPAHRKPLRLAVPALLALLAGLAAAPAAAQTVTLVSNTGQTGNAIASGNLDRAQRFTTGSNAAGYTLASIEITSVDSESDDATAAVWTVNASGFPDTVHASLTAPTGFDAGTLVFTAPASTELAASTTYAVVIQSPGGEILSLRSTTSDGEDAGGAAGWSIADAYDLKNTGGTWATAGSSQVFHITVKGAAKTGTTDTTAPAFESAAADGASLVITFDEDLAAAASLANSAFTVKKTASGGSEATVTLSTTVAPVISGTTVTLTLGTALVSTDGSVKVTYTKPTTGSANKLVDAASNETATFTDQTVTNNTPAVTVTVPGAPTSFAATAGDGEVTLSWAAPASDGGGAITEYEYRYSTGSTVSSSATWTDVTDGSDSGTSTADETGVTISSLTNGTEYAFEVRAVNSAGGGTATATKTATPAPTVSIAAVYPKATMRVANPEFRVTISAAQTTAVTVNLSIDQDASYLSSTTQSIEIPANETSATKKFSGFYGGTTSGDLTATVEAGTGYVPAATPANAATVDVVSPGILAMLSYFWAEAAYSVDEGDGLEVVVTLRTGANVPKPRESFSTYGILTEQLTGEGDMATQSSSGVPGDYTHTSVRPGTIAQGDWSADGAVFTATSTFTIPTTGDSAYEGNERFKIALTRAPGGLGNAGSPGETIVTIVDDETLEVTGVAVSSTPSGSSTYGAGETISFTATFSGPVTVTGTPQLPFSLGGVTKQAAYASGSDSTELVFSYTVAAGDNDADGVSWAADALSLNGGTIKFMTSVVANRVDAALTHAAGDAQSGHKVDTPPVLSTRTVNGTALVLTYNEALDTGSEPAGSAFTVKVGGTAVSLASSNPVAVSGRTATLTLAAAVTASDTVTVSYAVPTSNPLQDAGGTDAPAFSDLAVMNGTGNNAPVFNPTAVSRTVAENTAPGQNIGAAVTATDADTGDTLTYTLGGADAASFDIVSTSGQIQTKTGVTYDHEAKASYAVTVTASDSTDTADATVTISVTDVDEPPAAPAAPAVAATTGSTTSLDVTWTAPTNTGKPAIDNYDLQYRQGNSGNFTAGPQDQTGLTASIGSLTAGTSYQVQVRATNAEGDSDWSPSGSGTTNAVQTATAPVAPAAPTVAAVTGSSTSLAVSWIAPADGGSAITTYDVQYRQGTSGDFTNGPQDVGVTSATITELFDATPSTRSRCAPPTPWATPAGRPPDPAPPTTPTPPRPRWWTPCLLA